MDLFSQYGFFGVVLGGLVTWILIMRKDHKQEIGKRDEILNKISDKIDVNEKRTQDIIRDNTNILAGLKTLLENRK